MGYEAKIRKVLDSTLQRRHREYAVGYAENYVIAVKWLTECAEWLAGKQRVKK